MSVGRKSCERKPGANFHFHRVACGVALRVAPLASFKSLKILDFLSFFDSA